MSGKVDVLAQMDRSVEALCTGCLCENEVANDLKYARSAVYELIEASIDEARRTSITSLPLKIKLATDLGISLAEVDAWMLHTRRRFLKALERVRSQP